MLSLEVFFFFFFSCPADHVPDWQPRILLGMVEARSVNVTSTHNDRAGLRGYVQFNKYTYIHTSFVHHVTISADRGWPLASTRQLRSQDPVSVHAHRTEGATGSEGREGGNGVGGGIGDGNRVGGGNGDGAGTGVETRGRTQGGNGDGSGDGNESSSGDGNGDEDNGNGDGNEDGIGEGRGEAKKRKKPHRNWRRHVGNGGDLVG